jgi:hypothetical protein
MRIAVVGAGVSGLYAAQRLARRHETVLYEGQGRLGGHAHSHDVRDDAGRPLVVDTGFLVFNRTTYPRFTALLAELGVPHQPTDMALSVRCRACRLEYGMRGLSAALAWKRNVLRPSFTGMFLDIARFFRRAKAWLAGFSPGAGAPSTDMTVGEFLERGGYGDAFVRHWLLPTAGAVWSAPAGAVRAYSARMLLRFFEHHGFLQRRQLPWLTVTGGSRAYVEAIGRRLGDRARCGAPVRRVERVPGGVLVSAGAAEPERYDAVVFACHADEALAALADPTPAERSRLGRFGYARHRVLLHTDASFLPRSKAAWSSWNVDLRDCRDEAAPVAVTYHLNRLQGLDTSTPFCVTLNADREPRGVLAEMAYAHPLLTADAVAAQQEVAATQGERATWWAGAHLGNGFHEDGVESAHRVAAALGCAE